MKILIVDDEALIRELLVQIIEGIDDSIEILEASNGLEALEMIRQERPDIVFLDLMMPKISGFDICRILQGEHLLSNTNIVIISAKGQEADIQNARELGVKDYIVKPFKVDAVINVIARMLGK